MVPERLTTERFELRRFTRRDTDGLALAVRRSLPDLQLWLPWAHPGYDRDEAAAYVRDSTQSWREGRAFDFAIRPLDDDDGHIGNISIWQVTRMGRAGEIGYWIRSDRTGLGIATEVTARVMALGFERLGFHKINLRIAVGNKASERVAAKLGFTREGVLREELLIRGRWVDHTLYSILEHEWRTARTEAIRG
ncbi:MAG: GNAT family N-acetyltransferase [Acidimicrobiia bacterium]|nr:GNAT family N-acetyltransferase [Acidimicrobiia bacterium]MDH4307168.1 GNAT family N-acetyltransferase [Acidimicrobiia bacterium]MDH5293744.1 GNAT family N-acetyltransferase [Acidimicrobiia bacterium]